MTLFGMTLDQIFLEVLNLSLAALPLMAAVLILRLAFRRAPRRVVGLRWAAGWVWLGAPGPPEGPLGVSPAPARPAPRTPRARLVASRRRYMDHRGPDRAGRADRGRYPDGAVVAGYAQEAMAWAVSAGLIQGRSDSTLAPAGSATRAQTAVILHRLAGILEDL